MGIGPLADADATIT